MPNDTDIELHIGGTGGYPELNRYLYRLPLVPIHGQKIKVYNAAQYVAFSNINNSVSWIHVKMMTPQHHISSSAVPVRLLGTWRCASTVTPQKS